MPEPAAKGLVRQEPGLGAFVRAQLLFWSPVLVLIAVLELALWRTGETCPVEFVIREQARRPGTVWLRQYIDQDSGFYKWSNLLSRHPRVLALGSSRVLKFRAPMFGSAAPGFYNAGLLVNSIEDLDSFSTALPASVNPAVVILGIDEWWFNDAWEHEEQFTANIHGDHADWRGHAVVMRKVLFDGRARGLACAALLGHAKSGRIGMLALEDGRGFRSDGSDRSGFGTPSDATWRKVLAETSADLEERVRKGTDRYRPTGGLSARRLAELKSVLAMFRSRNILVIGYAPPFSRNIVTALEESKGRSRCWREFNQQVPAAFAEFGFPFVNAPSTAHYGLTDQYLRDSRHPEETFHLYVLREALWDSRVRKALPDAQSVIDRALASPKTTAWFPDLGERNNDTVGLPPWGGPDWERSRTRRQ